MTARAFDALLVDLDGTLLDFEGAVRPRNREALLAAEAAGVQVLVVTGRSRISAAPIIAELGLSSPSVAFNGATIHCPRTDRMLEERVLSKRTLERALSFGEHADLLTVVMCSGAKYALEPRNAHERAALELMTSLAFVPRAGLAVENVIRVSYLSDRHASTDASAREVERWVGHPTYITAFPLAELPQHRKSPVTVVDVHPPCRGKAEALRFLEETHAIPAARVIAIGDGSNDVPMLEAAGLGVAMAGASPHAIAAADRVIGGHEGHAIAELVEELLLDVPRAGERRA